AEPPAVLPAAPRVARLVALQVVPAQRLLELEAQVFLVAAETLTAPDSMVTPLALSTRKLMRAFVPRSVTTSKAPSLMVAGSSAASRKMETPSSSPVTQVR